MRRILKFETMPGPLLHLPIGPEDQIIHVAEQHTATSYPIRLWVEVRGPEPSGASEPGNTPRLSRWPDRLFRVMATGDEIPDNYRHRGTAVCMGGALIWHLYEVL